MIRKPRERKREWRAGFKFDEDDRTKTTDRLTLEEYARLVLRDMAGLYMMKEPALHQAGKRKLEELARAVAAGWRTSLDQGARRRDKPTSSVHDEARNKRIRAYHARLVSEGRKDATSATAAEFAETGLCTRSIQRILKR